MNEAPDPSPSGRGGTAGDELEVKREVVKTLLAHLAGEGEKAAPRETGPGWQALRTVQQEASCSEATPADPRLVRVPVPPPPCKP
jgi:hypothetical protein